MARVLALLIAGVGVAIVLGSQVGDAAVIADAGACHALLHGERPPQGAAGTAPDVTREERIRLFCDSLLNHRYLWAGVHVAGAVVIGLGIWAWFVGRRRDSAASPTQGVRRSG